MYYSLFEIFSVGIGPSSSHTVGPMKAAHRFTQNIKNSGNLKKIAHIETHLYGSLALTGVGHGTLKAIAYGFLGLNPEEMDVHTDYIAQIENDGKISLLGEHKISFCFKDDIILEKNVYLKEHSNGMKFTAFDRKGKILLEETYFSVGGGTIARADEIGRRIDRKPYDVPYQFNTCNELMQLCEQNKMSIAELVLQNEKAIWGNRSFVNKKLLKLWSIMEENIGLGLRTEGILPGGLKLKRHAREMYNRLKDKFKKNETDSLTAIDWINIWAIAVAEENAAGGRMVTAPTMGSAGVIPSVLRYMVRYGRFGSENDKKKAVITFLATASAICSLYRTNASISGAEVGCQGEIGVACSMAAGGLVAALSGTNKQIENAAEIAMEHNLGLTCDPIKGLVQVPCIERNAMGAMKAVNAARLALQRSSTHLVSLDSIIKTMYETGLSLNEKYKETSLGGIAKNALKC
ncbi:MAG TPA: L-serine ammonia-lyase [Alphaproteobacteria bacterium]|nr:L-serine ammonia-lyase [Alphaproteobacteria bacterium]